MPNWHGEVDIHTRLWRDPLLPNIPSGERAVVTSSNMYTDDDEKT